MNHLTTIFLIIFFLFTSEAADPAAYSCGQSSAIAIHPQRLDNLLLKLVSGTIQAGFIETSYGGGKDLIYGLGQCRGDVSIADCSSCIQDAAGQAHKLCPDTADAKIWYDYCFLRYSDVRFFDQVDTSGWFLINVENVTDPNTFNKKLADLADQISSDAVKPTNRGLGKGKSQISPFVRLYALVQCTRDLSEVNCGQCLAIAIDKFATVCADRKGCRVLYGSCYVRYELYPFFFPVDAPDQQPSSSMDHKSSMAVKT